MTLRVRSWVLGLLASLLLAVPVWAAEPVVLENAACRWEIAPEGTTRALLDRATQKNYAQADVPLMLAGRGQQSWSSSQVRFQDETLVVSFADAAVTVKAKVETHPQYFLLTVVELSGELDWLQLGNLRVTMTRNVGELVNAAWDERFAVCLMACNDQVDCGSHGVPTARAYREFGLVGARLAVIAVPTGGPDPASKLLDAIEVVELEQRLPHPTINGVWIKRAPERFASYLMVYGLSQKNIDEVLELARGGFGCIETFWWRTTPSYEPNPEQFPDGLAGMKQVADKVHAAGLQMGLHVMQGMVGWGPKDDPYLVPKADPRLLQDRHATLAAALDSQATEIATREATADWPEQGDLYLEGELVRYAKRLQQGFSGCQRGLHGTTVVSHAADARVGHLVNCFPLWNNAVYSPDVKTTMVDEICERIAKVFNAVGADMSYFDGGEDMQPQPPRWHNQGHIALGVQSRLKRPVVLEGNDIYTHLAWHVITRGGPDYDQVLFGRRAYTLRFKGQNPAKWARNLLTGDVGWFQAHVHSPSADAVTPDELMLLCLKAVGGKAPISIGIDAHDLHGNKRLPEMLQIIRTCDELKRRDYFTEEACAALRTPMAEHTLEQAADGGWDLRPLKFGPSWVTDARQSERWEYVYTNPHGEQTPWVRIRARHELMPHGSGENLVLTDPASGTLPKVDGTAAAELVQAVEPSPEKTPDGGAAFCYKAENRAKSPSGWSRLTLELPKPLDLSQHRRYGLWIRTEGSGGILNVQTAGTDARRDHYIGLENRGWTYVVLDAPEEERFFDYTWSYSFTDLMFTCWYVYNRVTHLHLYYNALPGESKTTCWIGRIEALHERPLPLVSPTLEANGQKLVFPVTLQPEEYVELDWAGGCRHFGPNGNVVGSVAPQGTLRLVPGENRVRFSSEASDANSARAEVTLSVRGEPLSNARRH